MYFTKNGKVACEVQHGAINSKNKLYTNKSLTLYLLNPSMTYYKLALPNCKNTKDLLITNRSIFKKCNLKGAFKWIVVRFGCP